MKNITYIKRSLVCKCCDSCDLFLVQSINASEIVTAWDCIFHLDISPEFQGINRIDLFECLNCHLAFFMPDSFPEKVNIYSHMEKFDWYYMPSKWEFNVALQDIQGSEKVLEIGSGFGAFIDLARNKKGINVVGIELNETAAKIANQRGLPVRSLDLRVLAESSFELYDAVCAFQVLEHISNPRELINWSCRIIRPGGKLLISVPNSDSFLKYQFNILDMPPHHMTRWSRKSLQYLCNLFPLRVDHIKEEPLADYHVAGYISAYCEEFVKRFKLFNLCRPRLKNFLSRFLISTRFRKLLRGHTIYTSFIRV